METELASKQECYKICYYYFEEYVKKYLKRDINRFNKKHKQSRKKNKKHEKYVKHKQVLAYEDEDLNEDLVSELKVRLFKTISKEYQNIRNWESFVYTTIGNDLPNILSVVVNRRKNEKMYSKESLYELQKEEETGNFTLAAYLSENDTLAIDFIDLCKKHLSIVEKTILFNVITGENYEKIGTLLKLTPDYVRKIYNKTEKKIVGLFKEEK